jgi:hypothetical protein
MAYPKMKKKKIGGWGIFGIGGDFCSGKVRFCISMVLNDTNIIFFLLKI